MTLAPPIVDCDRVHPGIAVSDLAASVEYYVSKLGFTQGFLWGDPPVFAGVNLGKTQLFLSQGRPTPNLDAAAAYFVVEDADALYRFHLASGVPIVQSIDDRPYQIRDYVARDPDGYLLVFGHYLMPKQPPLPIERVDLPVRIEKRLAALLADLAQHRGMTLNSCLEEILLHTNDGVEPHTKATVRYIAELKKKHGIDYDTHASYRFVEE